jgi:hypothetical protein
MSVSKEISRKLEEYNKAERETKDKYERASKVIDRLQIALVVVFVVVLFVIVRA